MGDDELKIDPTNHRRVPSTKERLWHSFLGIALGFALVQIIGFWMFPGAGFGGLYIIPSVHWSVSAAKGMAGNILITAMVLCGVLGWFKGKYFTDRLKGYITWWKFW
jgi:hypothetical protein